MIEVDVSSKTLERLEKAMDYMGGDAVTIIHDATKRAAQGFITDISRATSKKNRVRVGDVRKTLALNWRNLNGFEMALLTATGRRKNLADYYAIPSGARRGIMGAVKRAARHHLYKAWIMERGGKKIAYMRSRGQVRPIVSPSIPQIMKDEENVEIARRGAAERFEKRVNHWFKSVRW